MVGVRRAAAIWLVLFAAYAATIGLPAFGHSQFGGDEPHFLLTAKSIVDDGNIDLRDEYVTGAYRGFYPYALARQGRLTNGQADEPYGVGFALLIAPAYAIGGQLGVQLLLAAISALAFALAARIARRVVPEPWAGGAALACGLSPPALAYATTVTPEMTAGALLATAALLAFKVRERPRIRWIAGAAFALSVLPWLGLQFLVAGLVVALAMFHWLRRRARGFALLVELEVLLFSGIMFVTINDRLFGGFTPAAAALAGNRLEDLGASDFLDRAPRLVALWLDRSYGVLRWAPVMALAFYGLWLLWRSRRDHIARVLAERRDVEIVATLCALVCGGQVFVATFIAPTMFGFFFPGRYLVAAAPIAVALVAWGLRQAPRVGMALVVITLATSAWWYADLRLSGGAIVTPPSRVPLGPLDRLLPLFDTRSVGAGLVLAASAAGLVGLVAYELHRARARLEGL
jgi:4-amino-4-deoxy-L-arabinose transferase-like glycosyltransferase